VQTREDMAAQKCSILSWSAVDHVSIIERNSVATSWLKEIVCLFGFTVHQQFRSYGRKKERSFRLTSGITIFKASLVLKTTYLLELRDETPVIQTH
jgi:hypothetical protein